MTPQIPRASALFTTLFVLTIGWFAVPHASQEGANEGLILFTTDRHRPSASGMCADCEDIYVMSAEVNSEAGRLTEGGGNSTTPGSYNSAAPDWSHSKKIIVFQSNRIGLIPQIFVMNADGSQQQLLVDMGAQGAAFPSFSQSGNEVCFQNQDLLTNPPALRRRDIYIANVHGTGLTNLTSPEQPGQEGNNARCDFSPRGNIAFQSTRDGDEEIYVMNADGSDVVRLTGTSGSDANPAWSPKGDRIAFESNRDGNAEIYVMNADGSDPVRLTFFAGQDTKPTWSPKGDRIAFHRRMPFPPPPTGGAHLEVFMMDANGNNVTQITFTTPSPGFSGFPSWGKGFDRP